MTWKTFRLTGWRSHRSKSLLPLIGILICLWGCAHGGRPAAPEKSPHLKSGAVEKHETPQGEAIDFGYPDPTIEKPLADEASDSRHRVSRPAHLTLEKAVAEAVKASPELGQMHQRIEAASEQVKQVEASFFPRISMSEEFNATDNPVYALMHIINQRRLQPTVDFNHPGEQQNFSTRLRGEWSLFEGGTHYYGRKAAVNQRRSIQAELVAARNRLATKVTEVYYRWLQAMSFIGSAQRSLEAARTDERLGEARSSVEMALPSDIARLKARTAEVHGNLITAKSNARRLQAGLERLLARAIQPEELPDPSLYSDPLPELPAADDPEFLVKQALEKRPEISAVRAMVQAAFERVESAKGGFFPKVGASAQVQWDSEDLSKMADSWMVGIHASLPLFEGGMTLAGLREAKARLKEMERRGEQVALDISLEVRQAAVTVQEVMEKIKVQKERRNWAQKALEEVRHQYRNEVVAVDSLLQAEVAWNQAEVAYTAALFEGRIAQALLRQALGDFVDGMGAGVNRES